LSPRLQILLAAATFGISQCHTYRQHLIEDARGESNIGALMATLYLRILPMHLLIILGAIIARQWLDTCAVRCAENRYGNFWHPRRAQDAGEDQRRERSRACRTDFVNAKFNSALRKTPARSRRFAIRSTALDQPALCH
jgi:hypothetical protein